MYIFNSSWYKTEAPIFPFPFSLHTCEFVSPDPITSDYNTGVAANLLQTLLAEFRDQEDGAGERETCIAHRGVDRSGLSFGANPGGIFDNPLFFHCVYRLVWCHEEEINHG